MKRKKLTAWSFYTTDGRELVAFGDDEEHAASRVRSKLPSVTIGVGVAFGWFDRRTGMFERYEWAK